MARKHQLREQRAGTVINSSSRPRWFTYPRGSHGSYKVYALQQLTERIVAVLERLAPPGTGLAPWFRGIVADGTGHEFVLDHNKTWPRHARRIVEAFLHAHFFLEMTAKYGRAFATAPEQFPGGWAAVLELYGAL